MHQVGTSVRVLDDPRGAATTPMAGRYVASAPPPSAPCGSALGPRRRADGSHYLPLRREAPTLARIPNGRQVFEHGGPHFFAHSLSHGRARAWTSAHRRNHGVSRWAHQFSPALHAPARPPTIYLLCAAPSTSWLVVRCMCDSLNAPPRAAALRFGSLLGHLPAAIVSQAASDTAVLDTDREGPSPGRYERGSIPRIFYGGAERAPAACSSALAGGLMRATLSRSRPCGAASLPALLLREATSRPRSASGRAWPDPPSRPCGVDPLPSHPLRALRREESDQLPEVDPGRRLVYRGSRAHRDRVGARIAKALTVLAPLRHRRGLDHGMSICPAMRSLHGVRRRDREPGAPACR